MTEMVIVTTNYTLYISVQLLRTLMLPEKRGADFRGIPEVTTVGTELLREL